MNAPTSATPLASRALVILTCGALLTFVVEVTNSFTAPGRAINAIGLAGLFALVATVGFEWVRERGRPAAISYLAVQVPLGMAMFITNHTMVGASLLMVVLVMQAVLLLSLRVAAGVIAIVPLGHLGMSAPDGVRATVTTTVGTFFGAVLAQLLVREHRARTELAEAHAQLQGYAAQAEELATTHERNRLARDIHDGLGHHLTVVQMQLRAAQAVLPSDPTHTDELLTKAQGQTEEALAAVRRSVSAIREPAATRPLVESVKGLAAESSAAGVPTNVQTIGTVRELSADAEEALYRAAQEGLTNVRKHAEATYAHLLLDYTDPASVALEVRDDGRGRPRVVDGAMGFGLLGLQERAARHGGRLSIDSAPDRGLTLRVEMPG